MKTRHAVRTALRRAPALRKGLWLTVGFAVVGTALQVMIPVLVQQIVDLEILSDEGPDVGGLVQRAGLALAAMVLAAWAGREAIVRLSISASTGLADLRVSTFRHIHSRSVLHTQSEKRGALVSRVTSDIETIQDFMEWGGIGLMVGTAQVTLALVVMLVYDVLLTVLILAAVIVYGLLIGWFQRILARAHDRVRVTVATALGAMSEAISGLPIIRAYGAERSTVTKVSKALDEEFEAEYRTGRLGAFLFSSADVFAGGITAMVIGVGVMTGTTAGRLLAFLFLVNLMIEPVQTLVETLDSAQSAGAGLRRILGELDTPAEISDPPEGVTLPDRPIDVVVDGLSFQYPDGPVAVDGVSLSIDPGRRVAVVGETGSGKTTFTKLVTRLLDPSDGSIALAGISIDRVRFADLRRRVSFVPQEGFLFDDTILENVRYGRPAATDAEIAGAFEDLSLGDWVGELADGLETVVGERGGQLSAGERQLVALARAWLARPELLVLDEATSAVDPVLEVRLRNAIETLSQGRTTITVAHRLSTAETADEVIVFDGGRVVEHGSHQSLVAAGGVYAALHADWSAGTTVI
ncbi:MAG: ABC transporter ATP-binding protein/permease [Acidimicrobiia bacterium]|nr:ABC transporter ATP-binding protein/permease [Acidimicrobiia bacterium]